MALKLAADRLAEAPLEGFPLREDFALVLDESGPLGAHLHMTGSGERLAGFAWWDYVDARLSSMTLEGIPLGPAADPFYDGDQGWELTIWERAGFAFVAEGDAQGSGEFQRCFRVPVELYRSQWRRLLERVRADAKAFDSLAAALRHPSTAKTLCLGNQGLTGLPEELGRLANLEFLDLYLNKLTRLPETFGSLKKLRDLDLRFNKLTALPASFAALESLESVNLAENELSAIPDFVSGMRKLKVFYVPGNPIPPEALAAFRSARPDVEVGPPA